MSLSLVAKKEEIPVTYVPYKDNSRYTPEQLRDLRRKRGVGQVRRINKQEQISAKQISNRKKIKGKSTVPQVAQSRKNHRLNILI